MKKTKEIQEPDFYNVVFTGNISRLSSVNLKKLKVALQIHVYYIDVIDIIKTCLKNITVSFDCYISTDTLEKKYLIQEELKEVVPGRLLVEVFQNRGRDVMPFLIQMKDCYFKYDYICHFHTKKTVNSIYGDGWRDYLYRNLFGNEKNVNGILTLFELDNKIGIIYPYSYPIIKRQVEWGGNRFATWRLTRKLKIKTKLGKKAEFPAGDMFWIRSSAIKKVFAYQWSEKDFPEEKGQLNKTIMHCIERIWNYVCYDEGYYEKKIFNSCCENVKKKRLLICAITTDGKMDAQMCQEIYSSISSEVICIEYSDMKGGVGASSEEQSILIWKNFILDNEDIIKRFEEICLVSNMFFCNLKDISYLNDYFYLRDKEVAYVNLPGQQKKCGLILFKNSLCKSQDFLKFWKKMAHYKYQYLIDEISLAYGAIDVTVKENQNLYNFLEIYRGTRMYDFFQCILGNPFIVNEENCCGK